MELRDIEIFLMLAEELHFGRTAERLYVSPARISQVIKAQERFIGAPLFERTSRAVRLTEVGRRLRDDLRPIHAGFQESLERARMASRGVSARLRVGLMPFNFSGLWPLWKAFQRQHPQWEVQVRLAHFQEPFGQLRRGEFDVFLAWLPVEEPDLTVGPTLFTDPRVLTVAEDHPLAVRTSATVEVLGDFPVSAGELKLDYWEEGYLPFQTRRGRTIERGLRARHADEMITAVGMGEIVMPFPSHVAEYWNLPGIRYLPMPDLAPLSYALIWRTESENDLIRALAATARDLGTLNLQT
ncbi:MAG: LysR family transcriptional regulator [Catenulispora sp.]|nr:LysR family transcriptional regulator [Catenulispora sp.]